MTPHERLHKVCRRNAWNYTLEYSESPDEYELYIFGIGEGEDWRVRKFRELADGLRYIKDLITESAVVGNWYLDQMQLDLLDDTLTP